MFRSITKTGRVKESASLNEGLKLKRKLLLAKDLFLEHEDS